MGQDFEQSLKEIEANQDTEKIIETIEDLSPEELEAAFEMNEKGELDELTNLESDKDNSDLEKEIAKTPEQVDAELKSNQVKETVIPDTTPEEDKLKSDKVTGSITIDDNFIKAQPEKDHKILETIKGEIFSPKALKKYINAQRLIGKRQPEGQDKKEFIPKPEEIPLQPEITSEAIAKAKNELVFEQLKQQFPDIPEDPIEYKEYLADLQQSDPDRFWDLREQRKEIEKNVTKEVNLALYVRSNYDQINTKLFENEVEIIKNRLNEYGISDENDIKALGLDFTITQDTEGKPYNQLMNSLLIANGQLDPQLIQKMHGVSLLREGALTEKFFKVMTPKILGYFAKKNHKEGFTTATEKQKKIAGSVAEGSSGSPFGKGGFKMERDEDIDKLTPEQVDEAMKKVNI